MQLIITENILTVKRGNSPKIHNESALYYAIKKELQSQGYDVIKKLMWKDGHLYGDNTLPYIRGRKQNDKTPMIYDGAYAIRSIVEFYNKSDGFDLIIEGDLQAVKKVACN